jgi:hypothetical protein
METLHVYDNYEISGCCRFDDGDGRTFTETCVEEAAQFWTLYGHVNGEGVQAIGNFKSRVAAEQVFFRITGQPFTASYEASPRLRLMHAAPALLEALRETLGLLSGCMRNAERLGQPKVAAKIGTMISVNRTAIAEATHAPLPSARSPLEITEDEFDGRFPLVTNHLNPNASWGDTEGTGCLFETFGEELEFVRRQDPRTVWTLVDGEDGDLYLVSGYHFVNRIGYLISTVPVPEGADIQVRIPMQTEGDSEAPGSDEA